MTSDETAEILITRYSSLVISPEFYADVSAQNSGDYRAVAPPVPIPNTAVKRCSPDGSTATGRARVGRRQSKMPTRSTPVGILFSGVAFRGAHAPRVLAKAPGLRELSSPSLSTLNSQPSTCLMTVKPARIADEFVHK